MAFTVSQADMCDPGWTELMLVMARRSVSCMRSSARSTLPLSESQTRAGSERQRGWHHARLAEADQLGPLSSGLSRAWSWPLVATVTSDIVDVLELGKPPLWCVPSTKVYVKRFSMPAGALVAAPVGARFHPALARCQRLDSHCLRAHCTMKHPRVSTDHLVRQTILP